MAQKLTKKLAALCAGALLTITGAVNAPVAVAQERNLVAFGDSVLADPPLDTYFAARGSSEIQGSSGSSQGGSVDACPTSYNYAKRTAAKLRLPVADFSCTGATSMSAGKQISSQISQAIASGKLSAATQRVVFTSGFNDTYNNNQLSPAQTRAKFVRYTAPQIERIKRAAPNARIQIVGYASITHQGNLCLVNGQAPVPAPNISRWENTAQWMMIDLARATGTQFLDMKVPTRGNSMCAPDNRRMWAGIIDFTAGSGNMPFHLNTRGHEYVANIIARS